MCVFCVCDYRMVTPAKEKEHEQKKLAQQKARKEKAAQVGHVLLRFHPRLMKG
jgi:hypothetical protein